MNEVNYVFQYSQGKQTTLNDQIEYLITLSEYINTTFKLKNEPGKDSENVSFKGYTIEKYNAVCFIKDLGLYYEELYTNLSINVKYEVWENISYFTIYILSGIDEIIKNINNQGELPPTSPQYIVQMRVFELNKYIKNHINRIDLIHDRNFVDSIKKDHRYLISTYKKMKTTSNLV